jgi:hypothetical protein
MLPWIKKCFQHTNDMYVYIMKAVLKIMFPCHLKHTMQENAPTMSPQTHDAGKYTYQSIYFFFSIFDFLFV